MAFNAKRLDHLRDDCVISFCGWPNSGLYSSYPHEEFGHGLGCFDSLNFFASKWKQTMGGGRKALAEVAVTAAPLGESVSSLTRAKKVFCLAGAGPFTGGLFGGFDGVPTRRRFPGTVTKGPSLSDDSSLGCSGDVGGESSGSVSISSLSVSSSASVEARSEFGNPRSSATGDGTFFISA